MHDELRLLFDQDQADRHGELPSDLYARDLARRRQVEQLIADGALEDHQDYVHAAFIFQHGDRLEHYWKAHELAAGAVELGGDATARWLSAAAYDRWLTHQGKPQKFGARVGIVIEPEELFPTVIVIAREAGSAWILGGKRSRPELERLAGTLPE